MLFRVEREGEVYELNSKNQLDAFLQSGWKLVETPKVETPEESPTDKQKRAYTRRNQAK